ncbi:helix-turn-helix transcriptional regulator [Niabella sp.]|uniref:helix-turn-helix domain-containing protein n=1 Tax=Niabella sp. TaxID=1962976 RepID=UPI0026228FDC|nr:helix-turn-helix transcriptional regulator [Niabella sp.]
MKYFRTQLHLSQRELAAFLGISQSLLSMYEKDLRELPAGASLKLSQLQLQLQQFQRQKPAPDPKRSLHTQKSMLKLEKLLNRQILKAENDAERLGDVLDKMKEQQKQLELKLAFIKRLMEKDGPWPEDMSWMRNTALDARADLDGCDTAQQQPVIYKLLLLKAKLEVARQMQEIVKNNYRENRRRRVCED